jgi:DHA2 family multidrug resistance protein-like MFS transporter
MVPWMMAFVVGSPVTPRLARLVRPAHLMAAGLVLSSLGLVMLTRLGPTTGFLYFAIATWVFSLGSSPVFTLTTDLIIGSAPPERAGAASGLSETSAEFGGALGIALFGSIGVAIYRTIVGDALPATVSPEIADAAKATLGGALATAGQLPAQLSATLTDAARAAFMRGLEVCVWISAIGTMGLAAFAAIALRNVRPASERETAAAVDSQPVTSAVSS